MNVDTELEFWRQQWQSGTTVPLDLRRKVERQSRFMKIDFDPEILVTVAMGGATIGWAVLSPEPEAFCSRWRPGSTSPPPGRSRSASTAAPGLLPRRTRRPSSPFPCGAAEAGWRLSGLRRVCFCSSRLRPGLGLSQLPRASAVTIHVALVWLHSHRHCLAVYRGFFGFLVWFRRRKRAELAYLLGLKEQTLTHSA